MNDVFARRFNELDVKRAEIPFRQYEHGDGYYVPDGFWQGWATSVLSLIKAVFGEASTHFENFSAVYKKGSGSEDKVRILFDIFASAKGDFEGGYVFNVELRVSGEVFGDFVALARRSLDEGYKDVAAV